MEAKGQREQTSMAYYVPGVMPRPLNGLKLKFELSLLSMVTQLGRLDLTTYKICELM